MRKLKLFSLLAVLLCSATMWAATEFVYCYDCQRYPAYPTVNQTCELDGFTNPYVGNGALAGPWKLEFVGYYDPDNDEYHVSNPVDGTCSYYFSGWYSKTEEEQKELKRTIKVYALYQKQDGVWTLAARSNNYGYGVVVADNPSTNTALFISGQGRNGCFLTDVLYNSENSYNMEVTEDLSHPTPATPATSDNVDGIETAMAALVTAGGTTDLTINRTLYKDGFFNTLCLPFSLNASELAASPLAGCKLYSLSDASYGGDKLDLTITEETSLEAGMPYLIKWTSGSDITSMTFTGVTVTASTGSTVEKGGVRFVGTIGRSTLPNATNSTDYLFVGSGNELYYPIADDATSMKGFRAYFVVNNASEDVTRHAPARLVIAPKMPTAVENVSAKIGESEKRIENGQLFIIKNGVKYNAQGQMVK